MHRGSGPDIATIILAAIRTRQVFFGQRIGYGVWNPVLINMARKDSISTNEEISIRQIRYIGNVACRYAQ